MFTCPLHCTNKTLDLCPSKSKSTGSLNPPGTCFVKWPSRYCRNIRELVHPLSETSPAAPGVAPSIDSDIIRIPGKTNKVSTSTTTYGYRWRFATSHSLGFCSIPHTMCRGTWLSVIPFSPILKIPLGSSASGGRVVKLLACGARRPGFDSRPRHLDFQRLVISCFQFEIWLKDR